MQERSEQLTFKLTKPYPYNTFGLTGVAIDTQTERGKIYYLSGFPRKALTIKEASQYLKLAPNEIRELGTLPQITHHLLDERKTWYDEIDIVNYARNRHYWITGEKITEDEFFEMIR